MPLEMAWTRCNNTSLRIDIHQEWTRILLHTLLLRADHQYLNGQHLTCEVLIRVRAILTRRGILFIYKRIQVIISMPRADSGYTHNFMVKFWVFKDDESKSESKTNNRPWVCSLLVEGPHFARVEHAMSALGTLRKYWRTLTLVYGCMVVA